jgi:hypothetical protein
MRDRDAQTQPIPYYKDLIQTSIIKDKYSAFVGWTSSSPDDSPPLGPTTVPIVVEPDCEQLVLHVT